MQWRDLPPENVPPRMYYHAKFGRSMLKGVGISMGEALKNWECWNSAVLGWEAWLTPLYTSLQHVLPCQVW